MCYSSIEYLLYPNVFVKCNLIKSLNTVLPRQGPVAVRQPCCRTADLDLRRRGGPGAMLKPPSPLLRGNHILNYMHSSR